MMYIQVGGGLLIIGSVCGVIWMLLRTIVKKQVLISYTIVICLLIIHHIIVFFMGLPLLDVLYEDIWPMGDVKKFFNIGIKTNYDLCCLEYSDKANINNNTDVIVYINILFILYNSVTIFRIYAMKRM